MKKATKAQLREIRELMRDKKARDEGGLFAAEGFKIVHDMVDKGHKPKLILVSNSFATKETGNIFLDSLRDKAIQTVTATDAEFDKLSPHQHSQGILAVMRKPAVEKDIPRGPLKMMVLCDGIQDPGNLGTIIRTSAAFGAGAVLLNGETADVYNPKVVRASSGALVDIPIHSCDAEKIKSLKKEGYSLLASQSAQAGARKITEIKESEKPVILAFGSEGKGLSEEIVDLADVRYYIPISERIESLNVTQAVAISLYVFTNVPIR